ncbi:RNA 2',3'-cyclic phosphodiesterase [Roseicyclus sp. F158]|uniref:RNA 2',3'-cyclic phosphodiesterase n=1 Tax=Tropicimonas omnivorans TaxID=3075590 RepID=A0ABU3DGE9_9RHOB|nr:RNA 2',3'-cyclic phosphodiesterase [Roseicyclus sp. F158]MDT0682792.1 RNA 2',3'-cyclic phosphodiesterase [Roseicyclus sp. F158]
MIRLFAAIPLPGEVRERLTDIAIDTPVGRAVDADLVHLTLSFFGEVTEPQGADLHAALLEVKGAPFDLALSGLGVFGRTRPRIAYAAVLPSEPLMRLQAKVAQAGRAAGLELETRRFVPHVSLVRLSGHRAEAAPIADFVVEENDAFEESVEVTGFCLYRSTLHRDGPHYDRLHGYPLGAFREV